MHQAHDIAMPQFGANVNLTIFVAISNVFDRPLFMISNEGTSALMVREFLHRILAARTECDQHRPLRIVLDGR